MWVVGIINPLNHTSVKFTIVVFNWNDFTSYSIVLIMSFSADVFRPRHKYFRCKWFPLWLKHNIRVTYNLMVLYQVNFETGIYVLEFKIFVVINFLYGHCAHVHFNNGCLLSGVIFRKCTSCNLITSANMVTGLSIIVER